MQSANMESIQKIVDCLLDLLKAVEWSVYKSDSCQKVLLTA